MVMVMVIPIMPKQAITTYMMIFMVSDFFSTTTTGTRTTGSTVTTVPVEGTVVRGGKLWTKKSNVGGRKLWNGKSNIGGESFGLQLTTAIVLVFFGVYPLDGEGDGYTNHAQASCYHRYDDLQGDDFFSAATIRTENTGSTATTVPREEQLLDGESFGLGSQTYEEGKALDWEVIMSIDDIVMEFTIEFTEIKYWNYVYRNKRVANNVARNNLRRKPRHVTKLT
ncbi:hypothetical protein Tco_1373044 [Tanacetum coccineum]